MYLNRIFQFSIRNHSSRGTVTKPKEIKDYTDSTDVLG